MLGQQNDWTSNSQITAESSATAMAASVALKGMIHERNRSNERTTGIAQMSTVHEWIFSLHFSLLVGSQLKLRLFLSQKFLAFKE